MWWNKEYSRKGKYRVNKRKLWVKVGCIWWKKTKDSEGWIKLGYEQMQKKKKILRSNRKQWKVMTMQKIRKQKEQAFTKYNKGSKECGKRRRDRMRQNNI